MNWVNIDLGNCLYQTITSTNADLLQLELQGNLNYVIKRSSTKNLLEKLSARWQPYFWGLNLLFEGLMLH